MGLLNKVNIWGRELVLRTSGLAPKVYRDIFGASLTGDFIGIADDCFELGEKLQNIKDDDFSKYSKELGDYEEVSYSLLNIVYALNKTGNYGKDFPDYDEWLNEFETMDLTEADWIIEVVTVMQDGYFPDGLPGGSKKTKPTGV